MSKTLYTFAVLASEPARAIRTIVADHPSINDPEIGKKWLAAFKHGDVNYHGGDEINAINEIIQTALNDYPCTTVAFYRAVLDSWNKTALVLFDQVSEQYPEFKNDWALFLATGIAIVTPDNQRWLDLHSLDDEKIHTLTNQLEPAEYASRAFLNALFDWLDFCSATNSIGIITAQCLGASQDDSDFTINSQRAT